MLLSFLLGTVPVLLFLVALRWWDAYQLVPLRRIVAVISLGGCAALACVALGFSVWQLGRLTPFSSHWLVPLFEECMKALVVLWLFRQHRIGFLVDAAILGFAVGAGFAIVENLYYVVTAPQLPQAVWLVRGFGTAIMHGGVTAIFAVITQLLTEYKGKKSLYCCLPGLVVALLLHWLFNRFYLSPVTHTLLVVSILPLLLVVVFMRSALVMQRWLHEGLDDDVELLREIRSGEFGNSRRGRFLKTLRRQFNGPVTADMLCYIRLYTELTMRAKGVLMMREQGFDVGPGPGVLERQEELLYLQGSIGRAGMLALRPILGRDWRSHWQLQLARNLG